MTLQCKQWQRKTWEKWEVSINKRFCQCCLSIKQTCVLRATYPQQRKKTVYHKDKDLCLSLMWHISNTQQEKGAQLLLICLTIYPSSSFYPVQACKGKEPISAVRGPSQRDTQSLIYQANLEPVNLTQVLCGEHADTTQLFLTCPILLKCFCALLSSLYSTKHIFLNFLSSSSLLGNHFLNMGLTNQVSYKLTLSLTVKGDLEPGCVAIFTGGKRRSSGWCTVLHVHKTAQTLQQ